MAGSAAVVYKSGRQNCDVKMESERGNQARNGDLELCETSAARALTARDWPAIGRDPLVHATCLSC
jgi:hypothetical protein